MVSGVLGVALLTMLIWNVVFGYAGLETWRASGYAFQIAQAEARKKFPARPKVAVSMLKMPDTIFGGSFTFYFIVTDGLQPVGGLQFVVNTPSFFGGGCLNRGDLSYQSLEFEPASPNSAPPSR